MGLDPHEAFAAKKSRPNSSAPVVRNIYINAKNVFDPSIPGEDHWPYTWANALHIRTREHVIRREMLIKPGERAYPDVLEESERVLRALEFIKDARIRSVPVGEGKVDLYVETGDTWTTQPEMDFGHEGEENRFAAGFTEENLLGLGKGASYFYKDDPDGVSHQYLYKDPQLFGTRARMTTVFDDTPTGTKERVEIAQPFYSLLTKTAGGGGWNHNIGQQSVITNGVETNRYNRNHHDADLFVGRLLNRNPYNVHRLTLHYSYVTDRFKEDVRTLPGTLPSDRTITGPSIGWEWIQSNYVKETFIDRAERVEDFNLGHQAGISGGFAGKDMGSTSEVVPITVYHSFGFGQEGQQLSLTSYGMTGRYNTYAPGQTGGTLNNTLYFFNFNHYRHIPTEFPFTGVFHVESAYAQNIDTENQLILGGTNGLRGFKANSFTGNKTVLVNLEGRAFYPHEVLHLAYLGGAFFVDAGQSQPSGRPYNSKDIRASVGLGLRIALTRSSAGSVYRFDVAYALGQIQQDHRIVFSVAAGQGFKRSANSYDGFPGQPAVGN